MASKQLNLKRPSRDAAWGLRIGVVLAVVALGVALLALRGRSESGSAGAHHEGSLTAAHLEAYLRTAFDVRSGRQEARAAGWKPVTWADYPRISGALERVGWTMADYMRVEGQVNAARLELTDPGSVHDLDDPHSRPVPREHLELVRGRLAEVQRAQAPMTN